jgi:hypothetical protein
MINLVPNFFDFSSYILTSKSNWKSSMLSSNYLFWSMLYVVLMYYLFNIVKDAKFGSIILSAAIISGLGQISQFGLILESSSSVVVTFGIYAMQNLSDQLATDLVTISIIGRVARFIPEGFECTGTSLLVAVFNIALTNANNISANQLSHYGIKAGYMQRISEPMVWNTFYALIVIISMPIFLRHRLRRNKLDQLEEWSDLRTETWTEATSPGLRRKKDRKNRQTPSDDFYS